MADPLAPTGNATAEYRTVRTDAGLTGGRSRLIAVTGPDAVSFLQGLVSQDVGSVKPGQVARTMLLQPNGKLSALMWMGVDDLGVVLIVDEGVGESVASTLKRFRIRVDAEVVLDERPVAELWGPTACDRANVADFTFARRERGVVLAAAAGALPRVFAVGVDLAGHPVGDLAIEAVRVEAGEPVVGVDVDDRTIPQETGFVSEAVSFTKGCYLGQELVARIDTRGHVNKRLVGIRLSDAVLPPPMAAVVDAERGDVGIITSVAESLTVRAPIALATVRREVDLGSPVTVQWEGGTANGVIAALPFDDFTNS